MSTKKPSLLAEVVASVILDALVSVLAWYGLRGLHHAVPFWQLAALISAFVLLVHIAVPSRRPA